MPNYNTVSISVGGSVQDAAFHIDLVEVEVDQAVNLPSSFSLLLHDMGTTSRISSLTPGTVVSITIESAEAAASGSTPPLLSAKITSVEPVFAQNGNRLLRVRGYDDSFKLSQGKKTRTFLSQKDSDIASTIASGAGLTAGTIDATSTTYDYLAQYNQTDWDFLMGRAQRLGYLMGIDGDGKFFFMKPTAGATVALEWPANLIWFEPRLSVLGQITKTTVRSWDTKTKVAIEGSDAGGTSSPFRTTSAITVGSSTASTAISATVEEVLILPKLFDTGEASAIAKGKTLFAEGNYVQAEGECHGDPSLVAGCLADISGIGDEYAGTYFLTRVKHVYTQGSYTTQFSVSGAVPESLFSLLLPESRSNLIDGVVTALVTNLDDPDNLGRVKVKFPWLKDINGTEVESWWTRVAIIGGGATRGIAFIPEVNDEVLVAFDNGEFNAPYVVGALWNSTDTALTGLVGSGSDKGKIVQRVLKSRSGHQIILDDTTDAEKITIIDKTNNNKIEIDSKNNALTITSDATMTFTAKNDLTIQSTEGALILKSKGAASLTSSTDAAQIKGSTKTSLDGGGAKVELQASGAKMEGTQIDVKATAMLNLEGAMPTLKGSGITTIQGSLVKIN